MFEMLSVSSSFYSSLPVDKLDNSPRRRLIELQLFIFCSAVKLSQHLANFKSQAPKRFRPREKWVVK